jgi:hypothetical protein
MMLLRRKPRLWRQLFAIRDAESSWIEALRLLTQAT